MSSRLLSVKCKIVIPFLLSTSDFLLIVPSITFIGERSITLHCVMMRYGVKMFCTQYLCGLKKKSRPSGQNKMQKGLIKFGNFNGH